MQIFCYFVYTSNIYCKLMKSLYVLSHPGQTEETAEANGVGMGNMLFEKERD